MSASQAATFNVQEFADAGAPLASGRLYTYAFGTTTQLNAYTDVAGTVPHTYTSDGLGGQYIALNARGELPAPLYLNDSTPYDLKLNRADGSTVWTRRADGANKSSFVGSLLSSIGSTLVGFIQSGTGAVATTVQSKLRDVYITPEDFGAVGDGATDDTAALAAMFATGKPWYIPAKTYIISSTLTISADGHSSGGKLKTAPSFASVCVTFSDPGYGIKRHVTGLFVTSTTARVSGAVGIQIPFPNIVLDRCTAALFDYGIIVMSYSIMLLNCSAYLCKTNLSAYARSASTQINDLKIIGGNYDSATEYSCRIADPRFATGLLSGDPHGVSITIIGANFDGAVSTFDQIFSLNIQGCYWEGPSFGNAIELGGTGNNNLKNITIGGCYFSTVNYGIALKNSVAGLTVNPNYYSGLICALYAVLCEVTGFEYHAGVSVSGFTGPEVHTGFGGGSSVSSTTFSDVSISADYLTKGAQIAPARTGYTGNWYPNGKSLDGWVNVSSSLGRYRSVISTGIPGTQAGGAFTCTTLSDAKKFNGGDRVTGAGGSSFVRYVDYIAGVVYVNGSVTGAATISHESVPTFLGETLRGSGTPLGVVVAPPGSSYRDLTGGKLYQKETASDATGWVLK